MTADQFKFDLICQQHRIWQLNPNRGARADFTGQRLKNIKATDANLPGAIFTNAHIFHCDFTGADLSNITAAGTHFYECDFTDVTFKGAHMPRAEFTETVFWRTNFWSVTGDGAYIISLQLGGADVVYTSEIIQINCLRYSIDDIWKMPDEEVFSRIVEHTNEEKEEMKDWWYKWRDQIHQIVTKCPAKPVNNL